MEAELVRSKFRGHHPPGTRHDLAKSRTGNMDLMWKKQSIYKVPARMKYLNPEAYMPQLVSIGPYNYGQPHLRSIEAHKTRAVQRFLDRSKKSFNTFYSVLSHITAELMESYQQLEEEWKGDSDRFLQLMLFDGCFLYEFMRGFSQGWDGYDEQDPIFSNVALPNIFPDVLPDILMLENQLPLLVIERLIAVETDQLSQQHDAHVHALVFNLLHCAKPFPNVTPGQGLHILDVSRKVMAKGFLPKSEQNHKQSMAVKPALKLLSAGVEFDVSEPGSTYIFFAQGRLSLPRLKFDSTSEPYFLNAIAFECLHPTASREVSSYVAFIKGLISSVQDATALISLGVIDSNLGDSSIVSMVKTMSRNAFFDPSSNLCRVRDSLNEYHSIKKSKWKRQFRKLLPCLKKNHSMNHLMNPWSILSFLAALILFVLTLLQTVYAIKSYNY